MAYGDFKDLPRTTGCDKVLHGKAFDIAKNPKYDGYQGGLASMVYNFFNKLLSGGGIKSENLLNRKLDEELHKTFIRKFEKWKVYSSFKDNIWGTDLADM